MLYSTYQHYHPFLTTEQASNFTFCEWWAIYLCRLVTNPTKYHFLLYSERKSPSVGYHKTKIWTVPNTEHCWKSHKWYVYHISNVVVMCIILNIIGIKSSDFCCLVARLTSSYFSFIAICPYTKSYGKRKTHYLSVADDTGVLRIMELPKHLASSSDQAVCSIHFFQFRQ